MHPKPDDQRLMELEERLTHLEAGLEAVTRALMDRERELREAWLAIERLKGQLAEMAPPSVSSESEPPPPHY